MQFGLTHLIDPRLLPLVDASRAFYTQRTARRGPNSWEELRAVRASVAVPAPPNPPPTDERVGFEDRLVPVRIHLPPMGKKATGACVDLHDGGFYVGSPADRDVHNRRLADALGCAVVGVDYRLAPEHPWPAAPDDCEIVALWLAEHAESRFGTKNLFVTGFSAGATLAMSTLLRLRDRGPICASIPRHLTLSLATPLPWPGSHSATSTAGSRITCPPSCRWRMTRVLPDERRHVG